MTMESANSGNVFANQDFQVQTASLAPNLSVQERKEKFALATESVYTTNVSVCLVLQERLVKLRQSVQMIVLDMAHVPTDFVIASLPLEAQTVILL